MRVFFRHRDDEKRRTLTYCSKLNGMSLKSTAAGKLADKKVLFFANEVDWRLKNFGVNFFS